MRRTRQPPACFLPSFYHTCIYKSIQDTHESEIFYGSEKRAKNLAIRAPGLRYAFIAFQAESYDPGTGGLWKAGLAGQMNVSVTFHEQYQRFMRGSRK